jgi:pimeloyl-ACP methyl ester carboxylesterase
MTDFQITSIIIICVIVLIHTLRYIIKHTKIKAVNHQDFDGDLYQVGQSCVAYQPANNSTDIPKRTIVCMHGWLEDQRYFSPVHNNKNDELILINSCGYHLPNTQRSTKAATWQTPNPYPICTIEYDAAVLIMAVKNLASHSNLVLHGHSRGGAVIIEAIKQAPTLFAQAHVILEASILPEATVSKVQSYPKIVERILTPIILYIFPFIAYYLFKKTLSASTLKGMGLVNNENGFLLSGMSACAKSADVLQRNIENMLEWPLKNKMNILDNAKSGYILVGARDAVLSRRSMLKSANKHRGTLNIIHTEQSSHFISLDIPGQVKSFCNETPQVVAYLKGTSIN